MKSYQNGFTLVELLLVLVVVGILAAVTIPVLVKLKNQNGAILARAIEQIEVGCQNIIQEYNTETTDGSLTQTILGAGLNSAPSLGKSLAIATRAELISNYTYAFAKVPGEYRIGNFSSATDELDSVIAKITIDTNSFDEDPNENGKDQFNFELRNNGKLMPADNHARAMIESGFAE